MSLPLWIQEVKDRVDKATEGPWATCIEGCTCGNVYKEFDNGNALALIATRGDWDEGSDVRLSGDEAIANQDFIAHARDDMPKLIELVEGMAKALEDAETALRLTSDALYKTDKHDLFRETAQAQFQVQAMLRKYRGEDEDG